MIIVNDRELETLRHRLTQRDVTIQEVWRYLEINHQPHVGMEQQPLGSFVREQDLVSFWWLYDWWEPVRDKPQTLATPTIIQFCWYVNHTPGSPPTTFDMALQQFHARCVAHCKVVDLDPANPGETAEERKRRRNRERMAKVRGHRPVSAKLLKGDDVLAAQVRGLEAQVEMLKQTAKEEDLRLKEDVVGYQQRMIAASEERRKVAADFKQRVEDIQAEIRSLTTKQ